MLDETGKIYGRLTVIKFAGRRGRERVWQCVCSCGNVKNIAGGNLRKGTTSSCGCYTRERSRKNGKNFYLHGCSKHPLYEIWKGMLERCYRKGHISYKYYGGKGIKVADPWHDFNTFASDMGNRPSLNHSIERKDGDKDYSKENCCWATPEEQAANRKPLVPVGAVCTQTVGSETTLGVK